MIETSAFSLLKDSAIYEVEDDTESLRELPDNFEQITYLQSTGTQYIDTGVVPDVNTKVEITFDFLTLPERNTQIFGVKEYYSDNGINIMARARDNKWTEQFRTYFGADKCLGPNVEANKKYTFTINSSEIYSSYDGGEYQENITGNWAKDMTRNMFIFAINNQFEIYTGDLPLSKMRLYSCKIWQNDELIRDFIPCIKDDLTFGLFDVVGESFYANKGRGCFNVDLNSYVLTGTGTTEDPYLISNEKDLLYISANCYLDVTKLSGKTYKLTNDVMFNEGVFDENGNFTYKGVGRKVLYKFAQISNISNCSIDGNGYSIKGLKGGGLWAGTLNLVKDLNFEQIYLSGGNHLACFYTVNEIYDCRVLSGYVDSAFCGALARTVNVCAKNCYNYANVKTSNQCGGLFHNADYATIENCYNFGVISGSGGAGVVYSCVNGEIDSCFNYGQISGGTANAGICKNGNILKNCENYGDVSYSGYSFGIVHSAKEVSDCKNYGNIIVKNNYSAGICGGDVKQISHCENYGTIQAWQYCGGIATSVSKVTIFDCKNFGKIVPECGPRSYGGAIVGSFFFGSANTYLNIIDCYAEGNGTVVAWPYGGNTQYSTNIKIENCLFNFENVTTKTPLFGSTAYIAGGVNIDICNVKIILKEGFDSTISKDAYNIKIFNLLILCKNQPEKLTLVKNSLTQDIRSVIIVSDNKPVAYFGSNFKGFHYKWKTGEICLSAIDGITHFQGTIDERWLTEVHSAEKRG